MPSLLPGYEYDIFISYRHKDNKYDGWVSEFVSNLRKEVEATVKYYVSIYFDENSYDALLENHEVGESLQKKLRCLIFIPIISQTYCDEKSFAWQHEFLSFLALSSTDHYGLKIELPNHNVASRILPVRIHEIDQEDKDLIESHLGGPMRPIDFIYRSAGVNRPLRPKDDELKVDSNQAIYRNQVNKVANAIKEILTGIKGTSGMQIRKVPNQVPNLFSTRKTKRILALTGLVILLLSLAGYASYFYFISRESGYLADKSIAILPFRDLSADGSEQYFGDGVSEMIRTNLSQVNDLNITSMQSVLQYRDSKKTIPQIGEELKVGHVLEGSILKDGNSIRVIVQLIEAGSDKHIWSETYDRGLEDIFAIQSDIAQHVVTMLKLKLSNREKEVVEAAQETSVAAYDYILAGQYSFNKLINSRDGVYIDHAISQFKNALALDSLSVEALAGLGRAFYAKAYYGKGQQWLDSAHSVAEKILKINSNRAEGYALLGRVYYDQSEQEKAKENLEKALVRDPNNIRAMSLLSYIYREERNFDKGIPLAIKAVRLSPVGASDENTQLLNIGNILFEGGYFKLAEDAWRKHTMLYPDNFGGYESLIFLNLIEGKMDDARKILADHFNHRIDLDGIDDINYIMDYAWLYYITRQYDAAAPYFSALEKLDSSGFEEGIHTHIYKHRLAHIYKMKGETHKSEKLFQEHLASLEKTVKEGKSRFGLEYDLAGAYAFLGDKEKAYYWLNKMPYNMLTTIFIQIDPLFDSIRNEPQFRTVIDKQQKDREEIRRVIELQKVQQELKLVLR
jgi:TolB-like protein/Tfp pilus assembly protein PilF